MINLHPPLSAFPLALIITAGILELICFWKNSPTLRAAIRVNLLFAVLFVAATFFTGYRASELANQTFTIADDVIRAHHSVGRLLLFLIAPCAALEVLSTRATHNPKVFRILYLIFLAVCLGLVIYTGYLGGRLVFVEGAGVVAKLP